MTLHVCTTAEAETFLRLDSGDGGDTLDALMDLVDAKLARHVGREAWTSAERTEYHDGDTMYLWLKNWPVTATALYDDQDHVWAADTAITSTEYYVDAMGRVIFESGRYSAGTANIKAVYTAGYASEADIPQAIRSAYLAQLEHEWGERMRAGRAAQEYGTAKPPSGLLDDVRAMLAPYVRRIPFAAARA